ncbi:VanZ family protein [Campylobacter curvus]|uniref:VanZ family protein n=1 Tax=Campylobacter curvus TaxID=200 RepID=UPI00146FCB45|nr:VanZ family protein [Campylobacter curvus]
MIDIKLASKFSFFICLAVIEFLATTSRSIKIVENSWDKANHFAAFCVLYVLLSIGWESKFYMKFCILLLFGLQIEIVQHFLPNREFSLLDVFADCVGIAFGVIVIKILKRVSSGKI